MNIIGDTIGLTHVLAGVLAVISGGFVMALNKGTKLHKRFGYFYVASMLVLIVSSFGIYRLSGKFGIFHVLSIVSTISLLLGMLPMFKAVRTAKDYKTHFTRMYFSVVGLYAAFAAEILVRVNKFSGSFWLVVAFTFIASVLVAIVVFIRKKAEWESKFAKNS